MDSTFLVDSASLDFPRKLGFFSKGSASISQVLDFSGGLDYFLNGSASISRILNFSGGLDYLSKSSASPKFSRGLDFPQGLNLPSRASSQRPGFLSRTRFSLRTRLSSPALRTFSRKYGFLRSDALNFREHFNTRGLDFPRALSLAITPLTLEPSNTHSASPWASRALTPAELMPFPLPFHFPFCWQPPLSPVLLETSPLKHLASTAPATPLLSHSSLFLAAWFSAFLSRGVCLLVSHVRVKCGHVRFSEINHIWDGDEIVDSGQSNCCCHCFTTMPAHILSVGSLPLLLIASHFGCQRFLLLVASASLCACDYYYLWNHPAVAAGTSPAQRLSSYSPREGYVMSLESLPSACPFPN